MKNTILATFFSLFLITGCDATYTPDIGQPDASGDASASADGPVTDLPPNDMTSPLPVFNDPAAPLETAAGCRNGSGWTLNEKTAACPGRWSVMKGGEYAKMCSDGWLPCRLLPIPANLCASIKTGFFIGFPHGWQLNKLPQDASFRCQWESLEPNPYVEQRALFGCGSEKDVATAGPVSCGAFPQLVPCVPSQTSPAWSCPQMIVNTPSDADMDYITAPREMYGYRSGVLCCKN